MAARALIVGATGVVGRNLLRHLVDLEGWDVVAVSRRRPDVSGRFEHVAVDLTDRRATLEALGQPRGITHLFYSAYIEKADWAAMVEPNVAMLVNVLDAIEPVSPELQHVNLMHGTKWYGSHLGPFKTPAREDDPRHMPPNFYYDQQDHVAARQQGKAWSWSSARPHAVCGYATGNPMNLVMVLAAYATISKALGLPLKFPGTLRHYNALYQCTDADLLSRALIFMATEPRCANQAFNVTNGDVFRWANLWPRIAALFDMPVGPVQTIRLVETMRDKGDLWRDLVARHRLVDTPYEDAVAWAFGDFVFRSDYDIISSTTKLAMAGFPERMDSEDMILARIRELADMAVIPPPGGA